MRHEINLKYALMSKPIFEGLVRVR